MLFVLCTFFEKFLHNTCRGKLSAWERSAWGSQALHQRHGRKPRSREASCEREEGAPGSQAAPGTEGAHDSGAPTDGEGYGSIDASMNAHFSTIQEDFVPAEVQQLVDRLQGKLAELTDVGSHLQQLPPTIGTEEKLRMVVRLCLTHALASVWALSVVQLLARAKLNIIGRHLFLQEKLAKLAQPPPPPEDLLSLLSPFSAHRPKQQRLPPQLDPKAVEAFLACDSFMMHGLQWLMVKVMGGVELVLRDVSVTTEMGPQELLHFMRCALLASERSVGACVNWADLLVGTDAMTQTSNLHLGAAASGLEPQGAALAASTVEELHTELRDVLCSRRTSSALTASLRHALNAFASHLSASFPTKPAPSISITTAAPPHTLAPSPPQPSHHSESAHTQHAQGSPATHTHTFVGSVGDKQSHTGQGSAHEACHNASQPSCSQPSLSLQGDGLPPSHAPTASAAVPVDICHHRHTADSGRGAEAIQGLAQAERSDGLKQSLRDQSSEEGIAVQPLPGQAQSSDVGHCSSVGDVGSSGRSVLGPASARTHDQDGAAQQQQRQQQQQQQQAARVQLVKLARQIRGAADALMAEAGPAAKGMSALPAVTALSASIFASPGTFKL